MVSLKIKVYLYRCIILYLIIIFIKTTHKFDSSFIYIYTILLFNILLCTYGYILKKQKNMYINLKKLNKFMK